MAAYTTTQSSPGLLDTLRNTWGSRGNAKPALGLDLDRSFEELQRPKKGFLRSVVASFCLAPAVHGERTHPKLTDGLTDDEEDADAASEATTDAALLQMIKDAVDNADEIFDRMQDIAVETELLVASLRSVDQLFDLASRGFATFALPEPIATEFFKSSLADEAISAFEEAAQREPNKVATSSRVGG